MNIKTMSDIELQAFAWRHIKDIETLQANLRIINEELALREQASRENVQVQGPVEPVDEPKSKKRK